jgi:hypothetical protein
LSAIDMRPVLEVGLISRYYGANAGTFRLDLRRSCDGEPSIA